MKPASWRICFLLAAVFMSLGGPKHPQGDIPQMLANPAWFSSHAWVFLSFAALLAGLVLYDRSVEVTPPVRRWLRIAIVMTALETLEMALHTVAYMDLQNLLAGESTPVLTIHLMLAMIVYPVFGILMSGFMIVAARERALGSPWMAWIGVIGAVAHGAAGLLVIGFEIGAAGIGFALVMLVMVWAAIAALMPVRMPERPGVATAATGS
jgi:hypothetical protein